MLQPEEITKERYDAFYPQSWKSDSQPFEATHHVAQFVGGPEPDENLSVIQNYEAWLYYRDNILNKLYFYQTPNLSVFTEAYFEDHTLLALWERGHTGMLRFYVKDIQLHDEHLTVLYGNHLPSPHVTDDTCLGFAFITLPRIETLNRESVTVHVLPVEYIGDQYYELYPR